MYILIEICNKILAMDSMNIVAKQVTIATVALNTSLAGAVLNASSLVVAKISVDADTIPIIGGSQRDICKFKIFKLKSAESLQNVPIIIARRKCFFSMILICLVDKELSY